MTINIHEYFSNLDRGLNEYEIELVYVAVEIWRHRDEANFAYLKKGGVPADVADTEIFRHIVSIILLKYARELESPHYSMVMYYAYEITTGEGTITRGPRYDHARFHLDPVTWVRATRIVGITADGRRTTLKEPTGGEHEGTESKREPERR